MREHSTCLTFDLPHFTHFCFYPLYFVVLITMRILELYSGIGGMHHALNESQIPDTRIVAAVDINTVANAVYKFNFEKTPIFNRNITSLNIKELEQMGIDGIFMSPPCQPFTRLGLKRDEDDPRTCSLFHVLKIIEELKDLKVILLENVVGFEKSKTRDRLISTIKPKFNYKEFILSPCQFGVPNSRRRYYLIAKRKGLSFSFSDPSLIEEIPEELEIPLKTSIARISDVIDENFGADEENYSYLSEDILKKRFNVLDIRSPDSVGSCCFTKSYHRYVEGTGSVYSSLPELDVRKIQERLKKTTVLEERMELMKSLNLRFFTAEEVTRLMSFPRSFRFPINITDKQKYRLLGNSINVHVVSKLICILMKT